MATVADKSCVVDLSAGDGGGSGQPHSSAEVEDGGPRSSGADESSYQQRPRESGFHVREITGEPEKQGDSYDSEHSVEVDLEAGPTVPELQLPKTVKHCRICHLSFDGSNQESGFLMELGCSCKDDLAAAHKQCAEAWFKIKGNKTCEICGSTACNVPGSFEVEFVEESSEANDAAAAAAPMPQTETRTFWQGHRFLNFLLACMVFAFVISWLFHFNIPS